MVKLFLCEFVMRPISKLLDGEKVRVKVVKDPKRPPKLSLEEIKAKEKTKREFRQNKVASTATKQGSRASSINEEERRARK